MFDKPVKVYANYMCSVFCGNWICSGKLRNETWSTVADRLWFCNKVINSNKLFDKCVLDKI